MTPRAAERTSEILARYRAGKELVTVGRRSALAPAAEARRVAELLRAADDFGLVPQRQLAALFPSDPRTSRAVPLLTALSWAGASVVAR